MSSVLLGCARQWSGWKGEAVGDADREQVIELYLANDDKCLESEMLRRNCVSMGLDVSELMVYHCDLGPGNVLVGSDTRGIRVVD
jgi:Ser/Thr protein kinase RdoA (MazF antagonist)